PIPLPELPGIRFLEDVGGLFEEAESMEHCIMTRAQYAVDGNSYLFHSDYQGESASIEVGARSGKVMQAAGPGNTRNEAAEWGTRMLNQWGEALVGIEPTPAPVALQVELPVPADMPF
ncbi:hypothetical protein LCGC14_2549610, partial [marine sediment metagenome]